MDHCSSFCTDSMTPFTHNGHDLLLCLSPYTTTTTTTTVNTASPSNNQQQLATNATQDIVLLSTNTKCVIQTLSLPNDMTFQATPTQVATSSGQSSSSHRDVPPLSQQYPRRAISIKSCKYTGIVACLCSDGYVHVYVPNLEETAPIYYGQSKRDPTHDTNTSTPYESSPFPPILKYHTTIHPMEQTSNNADTNSDNNNNNNNNRENPSANLLQISLSSNSYLLLKTSTTFQIHQILIKTTATTTTSTDSSNNNNAQSLLIYEYETGFVTPKKEKRKMMATQKNSDRTAGRPSFTSPLDPSSSNTSSSGGTKGRTISLDTYGIGGSQCPPPMLHDLVSGSTSSNGEGTTSLTASISTPNINDVTTSVEQQPHQQGNMKNDTTTTNSKAKSEEGVKDTLLHAQLSPSGEYVCVVFGSCFTEGVIFTRQHQPPTEQRDEEQQQQQQPTTTKVYDKLRTTTLLHSSEITDIQFHKFRPPPLSSTATVGGGYSTTTVLMTMSQNFTTRIYTLSTVPQSSSSSSGAGKSVTKIRKVSQWMISSSDKTGDLLVPSSSTLPQTQTATAPTANTNTNKSNVTGAYVGFVDILPMADINSQTFKNSVFETPYEYESTWNSCGVPSSSSFPPSPPSSPSSPGGSSRKLHSPRRNVVKRASLQTGSKPQDGGNNLKNHQLPSPNLPSSSSTTGNNRHNNNDSSNQNQNQSDYFQALTKRQSSFLQSSSTLATPTITFDRKLPGIWIYEVVGGSCLRLLNLSRYLSYHGGGSTGGKGNNTTSSSSSSSLSSPSGGGGNSSSSSSGGSSGGNDDISGGGGGAPLLLDTLNCKVDYDFVRSWVGESGISSRSRSRSGNRGGSDSDSDSDSGLSSPPFPQIINNSGSIIVQAMREGWEVMTTPHTLRLTCFERSNAIQSFPPSPTPGAPSSVLTTTSMTTAAIAKVLTLPLIYSGGGDSLVFEVGDGGKDWMAFDLSKHVNLKV